MKAKKALVGAAVVGVMIFSGTALWAAGPGSPITINNFSFENPPLGPGGQTNDVLGWIEEGEYAPSGTGIYRPGGATYPGGVPDGTNVAFRLTGDTIWQKTSKTIEGNDHSYTFSAYIGKRGDTAMPQTTLELRAGNTYSSSTLLDSLVIPANGVVDGTFSNFVLSFDQTDGGFASLIAANVGKPVIVAFSFGSAFQESDIDLVQLNYVPEPGSLTLLSFGGMLLLARLRRPR